ncbi:MAG TPA: flagellar assembly peptidoglycan hydrolase FlgJ [Steroidobacteraceae bacterium]|nr:flagellar assembly peptidoglycan hydrolase FlgJ [Steroidobacteraceae bacterium]
MAVRMDPNVSNVAAQQPAQADAAPANALDFKQFAAMRRADGNDPKALREVARQFESIFTKMMLEGMRSASFGDPMFGSDQSDMYQGMMDDQMAVQLSSGRGIGLADMLFRQLSQGGQGAGARAAFDAATAPAPRRAGGSGATESADVDDGQRRRFIEQILPHARAAAMQLGVDERSVIAQAALETGWGTSKPADGSGTSNNFFGIKAGATWRGPTVTSGTTEFTNGVAGAEQAQFRSYGSVAENVSDYVHVLTGNPRYAAALNTGTDVRAFANALQRGGYATDPQYAEKLVAVAAKLGSLDVNSFKSGDPSPIEEGPIRIARTVEGNG